MFIQLAANAAIPNTRSNAVLTWIRSVWGRKRRQIGHPICDNNDRLPWWQMFLRGDGSVVASLEP
jgi:hypothetical protein